MTPDLTQDIYEALGLGMGQAGKTLQAGESYVLADGYDPGNPQRQIAEMRPVVMHPATGRRFLVTLQETATDTPPDASIPVKEIDDEVMAQPLPEDLFPAGSPLNPALTSSADGAVRPQPDPQGPVIQFGLTPEGGQMEQPRTVGTELLDEPTERPEPLQSFTHDPQPEEPDSNVPEDFELKVEEINKSLAPGAPLPAPTEPESQRDSDQT